MKRLVAAAACITYSVALAPRLVAQDAASSSPTAAWKPRASLRAAATWRDEGLSREDDFDPEATTRLWLPWLEVGVAAVQADASLHVSVAPQKRSPVREARVAWQAAPGAAFTWRASAGVERVLLGGFEQAEWDAATLSVSPWLRYHFPFRDRARVVETAEGPVLEDEADAGAETRGASPMAPSPWSRAAATVRFGDADGSWAAVQFLDDVLKGRDAAANFHKDDKQPAAIVAVGTALAGIASRLEVATYDLNHSSALCFGVKAALGRATLTLDQALDVRRATVAEPRSNIESRYHSTSIRGRWQAPSTRWTAQLGVASLEVDQPDSPAAGLIGQRANSPGIELDDNALAVDAAAFWSLPGDAVRPYVSVRRLGGRFRSVSSTDSVEAKAELTLEAGVVASL